MREVKIYPVEKMTRTQKRFAKMAVEYVIGDTWLTKAANRSSYVPAYINTMEFRINQERQSGALMMLVDGHMVAKYFVWIYGKEVTGE